PVRRLAPHAVQRREFAVVAAVVAASGASCGSFARGPTPLFRLDHLALSDFVRALTAPAKSARAIQVCICSLPMTTERTLQRFHSSLIINLISSERIACCTSWILFPVVTTRCEFAASRSCCA